MNVTLTACFFCWIDYVLSEFMNSEKEMSKIIYDGWKNGITEPNPLDDLSGMDVARKILILFRLVHG